MSDTDNIKKRRNCKTFLKKYKKTNVKLKFIFLNQIFYFLFYFIYTWAKFLVYCYRYEAI